MVSEEIAPAINPAEPQAASSYEAALALYRQGQYSEVEAALAGAVQQAPGDFALWNLRGITLRRMQRFTEAVWCFRRGLESAPEHAALWSNLGSTLADLKHAASAIACHRRAIEILPDDSGAHHNLGRALSLANRHAEALAAYNRAIALNPDDPHARWSRARCHLHLGEYTAGWAEYEARFQTGALPSRDVPGKKWAGESYKRKRLLIVSEQGFGDAIWMARYLRRVKSLGGELIMECRPEQIPLIRGMGVVDQLIPKSDPLPDADLHIHQCSLPGLFTRRFREVPREPYLTPARARGAKFAPLLAKAMGKLRVGIVWSDSTSFAGNSDRAVPVRSFLEWFALPGVQLYSLQKGAPADQLQKLPKGAPLIDLAPSIEDFADTAAAIAGLDLVVTTDTAVAHLAGALGKPVWLLLNYVPHWLWLLDRSDSPWYPSMRLFRQRAWGDWTGVFDEAAAALLMLAGRRSAPAPTANI